MVDLRKVEQIHTVLGCNPDYRMDLHDHADHTMLLFPMWGTFKVASDGRKAHLWTMERQVLIVPAGVTHATMATTSQQRHVAIYLQADFGTYLARKDAAGALPTHSGVRQLSQDASHLLAVLGRNLGTRASDGTGRFAGLAEIIVRECLANSATTEGAPMAMGHGRQLAEAVIGQLSQDPGAELDLDSLARRNGVSRRHLTRLVREHTGHSVAELQLGLRLEEARRLLLGTPLSVQMIALEVGFESASSFTRAFRRRFDCTPRDIRMARRAQN
ncbi:helix-turn-helix domain-containing protein [Pseudooceanicola sp. GBMRC 2024]|uniref:Helix-turn-helix domain-containing protein n=1 Tax=Pseudooceanicola albus TaxID=2692189 RepID=A0A6L7G2R5_9RHOB|nr:AraC family transcriptional regulator [Pseudooceanicola albus]MXN17726.1 helix-turn-helix domain-containing protein [Pseudooceanicola albus]